MCIDVRKECRCGGRTTRFLLRDNLLIPEVIKELYCPDCSGEYKVNSDSMVFDNGWAIEYDMPLARSICLQKRGLDESEVTPEFLFDSGYATWLELYPGEQEEIREEKNRIVELAKTDQKQYLKKIHDWNRERIDQLQKIGWRKARNL